MRVVKRAMFSDDQSYKAAKKAERKSDIGRRSGRRGTAIWGIWKESE